MSASRDNTQPLTDHQLQAHLERKLAASRAAAAARAKTSRSQFRADAKAAPESAQPVPPTAPAPSLFTWVDAVVFLRPIFIAAVMLLIARLSGVLS